MRKPRAGLLVPFVGFYEQIVPLREEKAAFAQSARELLAAGFEVVAPGLVENEQEAANAALLFASSEVDFIVVVPAVAVFGALGWACVKDLPLPVCIWNQQPASVVPEGYDIQNLIRNSGGLGAQALANTMARAGRFYCVAFSSAGEPVPAKITCFARACLLASELRRTRFGIIGPVFEQMTDVAMDAVTWTEQTGSQVVSIDTREWTRRYLAAPVQMVTARVGEIVKEHTIENIGDAELERSARLSVALDTAVTDLNLGGGAFNCHGIHCLQNPEIGVTACYAVSRQTSLGRPFTCTGDLPTAVALWVVKNLAGCAIYGELDLVASPHDMVLLANGGEGDWTGQTGRVTVSGNENFAGKHGRGASLQMTLPPGPATILSFTPMGSGYRFVVAEGEILQVHLPRLAVFHCGFRFRNLNAAQGFERWCEAGAVHHLGLAPGHWTGEIRLLAEILKFGCVDLTPLT